jgi:hypothetical protein
VIRYALACERGHAFESWFNGSDAFERQAARGLVGCPICGSTKVGKAIMAPAVGKHEPRRPAAAPEPPKAPVAMLSDKERVLRTKLKELRDHVVKNADYVGGKFPEEARKMHYGEIEHRSIYGEASAADAAELIEEGIELHPLPVLPEERN